MKGHRAVVLRKPSPLSTRDVDTMMGALFDIRANTEEILDLLTDNGEEEQEDLDS